MTNEGTNGSYPQGTTSLGRYQVLSVAAGANIIPQGGPTGGTLANMIPAAAQSSPAAAANGKKAKK